MLSLRPARAAARVHPGAARPDRPPGRGRSRPTDHVPARPLLGSAGRRARRAAWSGAVPRHRRQPRRSTPRPSRPPGRTRLGRRCSSCCPAARPCSRSGSPSTWPAASRAGFPAGSGSARSRSTTRSTGTPSTGTRCRRVAEVQRHLTQVDRPDLLLLACLLPRHRQAARRGCRPRRRSVHRSPATPSESIGLPEADADLVERLVREHLTLADLATRRDHGDPATVDALVAAVDGRLEVLRPAALPDRGRRDARPDRPPGPRGGPS